MCSFLNTCISWLNGVVSIKKYTHVRHDIDLASIFNALESPNFDIPIYVLPIVKYVNISVFSVDMLMIIASMLIIIKINGIESSFRYSLIPILDVDSIIIDIVAIIAIWYTGFSIINDIIKNSMENIVFMYGFFR